MKFLFPISYLPPLSYLLKCRDAVEIIIEQHEHFVKQTYRNRCYIYGPNGKQALIIPIRHQNLYKIPIKEVKISFETKWKTIHWRSVCAAYRNAPYFEYYEDELKSAFDFESEYLFDYNLNLTKTLLQFFRIDKKIVFTETYEKEPQSVLNLLHESDPSFKAGTINPYHQVFYNKHGFIENLSCIDFLFNEGPKLDQ